MSNSPLQPKPGKVQAIAIMTLINGILNILWGIGLTGSVVLGTLGVGLLCAPLTILPLVLGIFEIIGGVKLMGEPPRKFNVQTIAILEIVAILAGDGISLIVGILNLVFYNEPPTKQYIDSLPS
ncbi:MAG TPA: hypothetical protein DF984_01910 [Anaerolineaceae bacterium]|jgi:uncharacterized membrane protein|nr:hypothetical protein [Anaerolineaceae bacterium]